MGATSNEICHIREARDYTAGGGITSASPQVGDQELLQT